MSVTLDGVDLSTGLQWTDEFEWTPIEQSVELSLTGTPIVDNALKQSGRPVTLSADRNHGWMPRATVLALQALMTPGRVMALNWHGQIKNVIWRHEDKPLEVEALLWAEPPLDPADFVICTLKLMEI